MEKKEMKSFGEDYCQEDVAHGTVTAPLVEISQMSDAELIVQLPTCASFDGCNESNSSFSDSLSASFVNFKKRGKKIQSKLTYVQQTDPGKREKNVLSNTVLQSANCIEDKSTKDCVTAPFSECEAASGENLLRKSVCPLCWKQFERKEIFSAHMKTCAVKHNLSLKQLMDALELQTKQTEERKALGLPALPQNVTTKKCTSRKSSSAKDGNDPDLQLGLALSVSMREAEEQKLLQEQDVLIEAGLGHEMIATQATLLERFGFTSSRPALSCMLPSSRQGKLKLKGSTPLLLLRSQEERERLITEKVALILTADEITDAVNEDTRYLIGSGSFLKSKRLHELCSKEWVLWKLASMQPTEGDSNLYYIQNLSNYIAPAKVNTGKKLKNSLKVPCPFTSPGRSRDVTSVSAPITAAESQNMSAQQWCEPVVRSPSLSHSSFLGELAHDWKRLLNQDERSDVTVFAKDGQKINVHELVLYVRCPAILSDVQEENARTNCLKSILWNNVPYESAYAFLEFIYSGRVNKIMKISSGFESILMLADRYNITDLQSHLRLVEKIRARRLKKKTPIRNQESTGTASPNVSPDNSQSLLSPNCKSPRKLKRRSEPKSDKKHHTDEDCGTCDKSSGKSPSPDPFSDTNTDLNEENNASTQQDMDHLINLLQSSPDCNTKGCQGVLFSTSYEENLSSPQAKFAHHNLDLEKILSKEKRKYIEDTNSAGEGNNLKLKRICVESKHSVRSSLLEKFTEISASSQQGDLLTIDLTQSSGRSDVKTLTPLSSQDSLPSREDELLCGGKELPSQEDGNKNSVHNRASPISSSNLVMSSPIIKEKICNTLVNTNNESNDESVAESTDILGDFCADFEYNNYYYNYSPYRTSNKTCNEKSSPVATSERVSGSPKGCESRKRNAYSIRRSLSQNVLDNEVLLTSPLLKEQRSGDYSSSNVPSAVSLKCLSQDSIHLKSHNTPPCKKARDLYLSKVNRSSDLPEYSLSQAVLNSVSHGQKKKSSGNHSLSSIKCMLEDSYVDELGSSTFWRETIDSLPDEKVNRTSTSIEASELSCEGTPQTYTQGMTASDVTPMPDYSVMETPMLKRQLHKYGLKPLKKKQAKLILKHIYDELHPYVEAEEAKSEDIPEMTQPTKKHISVSPLETISDNHEQNIDTSVSSSQGSSSSQSDFVPTEEFTDEVGLTQMNPADVKAAIEELIKSNESLHKKVLLYEPIWLEDIHSALREKKYKFKLEQVIEFLDEQCITFRTEQKRPVKKRTKKKT